MEPSVLAGREPLLRIRGRNVSKADVLVHDVGGRRIALKDYGGRPFWSRNIAGRWLVAREARAYLAARGVEGVAVFLGTVGPFALATEWIEGTRLADSSVRDLPPSVFAALERIVSSLHARGIAIGDLHHRDIIVTLDGSVRIVDLATAWILGPNPWAPRRWIFRRLAGLDRIALARLRARAEGRDEAEAIEAAGPSAARWYALGRRLKSAWDGLRRRD